LSTAHKDEPAQNFDTPTKEPPQAIVATRKILILAEVD
jgi:hypothetical protein